MRLGPRVLGWRDREYIYLLRDVCYRAVERATGALPVTEGVLWKELAERGVLSRGGRTRLQANITLDGRSRWVYRLARDKAESAWR